MNIKTEKGFFDIPVDFEVEASIKNPLFTEVGSQTVPLAVPATSNNLWLCNHPDRLDFDSVPVPVPLSVGLGPVCKTGSLIISAAGAEGINGTIYFDDGEFYSQIKNKKLSELSALKVRGKPDGGDPWKGNVPLLIEYLTAVMREEAEDDFMIFPLCVEYKETEDGTPGKGLILNETVDTGESTEVFKFRVSQTETIDGKLTTLPAGYGITPFLRIYRLVDFLFESFGYRLLNNPWSQSEQMRRLCVVNTTADTLLRADSDSHVGMIDYTQIVPDDKITDFIGVLMVLGFVPYIDSGSRTARFVKISEIMTGDPDADLTDRLINDLTLKFEKAKQLTLSATAVMQPQFDKYEDMIRRYSVYGPPVMRNEADFEPDGSTGSYWFTVRASTGNYYLINDSGNSSRRFVKFVSSPYFNHDADTDKEKHDMKGEFIFAGMEFPYIKDDFPETHKPLRLMPMFTKGIRHLNSQVRLSDGTMVKEQKSELKTSLCFARGRARDAAGNPLKYFYGSTRHRDNEGNIEPGFDLNLQFDSPDGKGIYDTYFKEFDEFLSLRAYIECELKLDSTEIDELDISVAKRIKNREALIESADYVIDSPDRRVKIKAWIRK